MAKENTDRFEVVIPGKTVERVGYGEIVKRFNTGSMPGGPDFTISLEAGDGKNLPTMSEQLLNEAIDLILS